MDSDRLKGLAAEPEADRAVGGAYAELIEGLSRAHGQHQRLLAELGASERRFRVLARRVWHVQEEERRRVARELHDGLGQTLTALKNELDRLAAGADSAAQAERLSDAAAIAAEALATTRELSRLLRPAMLDDLGLEAALTWLARTLGERNGFAVDLKIRGADGRLSPELETLLFRVAQEALTNAQKHSGAAGAKLELEYRKRRVALVVSDDGRGCDPALALAAGEAGKGLGLRSIRDRVELYGGRFEFTSSPGAGLRIEIDLPLDEREGR